VTAVVFAAVFALPAAADTVNVYTIGSNPPGLAVDPGGTNIGGVAVITWNHNVAFGGPATLEILAEGIDTNENDEVFFNNVSIGFLTKQGFQSALFNLQPGPGALPGITANTVSVFNVVALAGVNTVRVELDTENWVNEIEVSTSTVVPEPATAACWVVPALFWRLRCASGEGDQKEWAAPGRSLRFGTRRIRE
jgi:hypothetical protein